MPKMQIIHKRPPTYICHDVINIIMKYYWKHFLESKQIFLREFNRYFPMGIFALDTCYQTMYRTFDKKRFIDFYVNNNRKRKYML